MVQHEIYSTKIYDRNRVFLSHVPGLQRRIVFSTALLGGVLSKTVKRSIRPVANASCALVFEKGKMLEGEREQEICFNWNTLVVSLSLRDPPCQDSLDVLPMHIKVSEWVWTPIHPSTAFVSFCLFLPFHPDSPDHETWCNIVQHREVRRPDSRPVSECDFLSKLLCINPNC